MAKLVSAAQHRSGRAPLLLLFLLFRTPSATKHNFLFTLFFFKSNGILSADKKLEALPVPETPLGSTALSVTPWNGLGSPLFRNIPAALWPRRGRSHTKPVLGTGLPGSPSPHACSRPSPAALSLCARRLRHCRWLMRRLAELP